VRLLTFHDYFHTLDETMDDLEGLRCGKPSLVGCESVQPLQDGVDALFSGKLLNRFDYVAPE
jgi:hypothetical protein